MASGMGPRLSQRKGAIKNGLLILDFAKCHLEVCGELSYSALLVNVRFSQIEISWCPGRGKETCHVLALLSWIFLREVCLATAVLLKRPASSICSPPSGSSFTIFRKQRSWNPRNRGKRQDPDKRSNPSRFTDSSWCYNHKDLPTTKLSSSRTKQALLGLSLNHPVRKHAPKALRLR